MYDRNTGLLGGCNFAQAGSADRKVIELEPFQVLYTPNGVGTGQLKYI